jgi:peptide chain release factor subunit 1
MDGRGLPVLSAYVRVPVDPRDRAELLGRVNSLLDTVEPKAKDRSVEREVRLSLRGDIDRVREAVRSEHWVPGSVVFFSCAGHDLFEAVQLPRPVRDRVVLDGTAWARPMLAVLQEFARCCVPVVDRASARVWELYADEVQEVDKVSDRRLRKPNYAANLAEDRVRNKAEELAKKHFRHTAAELAQRWDTDPCDVIVVGGHQHEVTGFLDALPPELREKVVGTFAVDPSTLTVGEIKDKAGAILTGYERDLDVRMVDDVMDRAAAGGLGAVGVPECLHAGAFQAIDALLLQDGATLTGVVCGNCGWVGLSGSTCPLCEHPTRRTEDVLDQLAQAVIDESGSIRHIRADTPIKEHVAAAALRFRPPPLP